MMNEFERKLSQEKYDGLYACRLETIQINVGLKCNQSCRHCHVEASPERLELMDWATMEMIVKTIRRLPALKLVDLTGGAPEMNPQLPRLVSALQPHDLRIQIRTNLTAMLDIGLEPWSRFLYDNKVELVASLPCYLEENVSAQRGDGVFQNCIEVIRHLNQLGYGQEDGLILNLVYNPGGLFLPPDQFGLEADYRQQLLARFGVKFSRLYTITNMPIGRYLDQLSHNNQLQPYLQLLRGAFNPQTIDSLMCRHQLNIGWDGALYDCDFNLALKLPVNHGAPNHIKMFEPSALVHRRIVTGDHCFGCTAGCGSSCAGALT